MNDWLIDYIGDGRVSESRITSSSSENWRRRDEECGEVFKLSRWSSTIRRGEGEVPEEVYRFAERVGRREGGDE